MAYDLLIQNATIVDGTARPAELSSMGSAGYGSRGCGELEFSHNQHPRHTRADGARVPSRLGSEEEIYALGEVVGEFPGGDVQTIKTAATAEYIHWASDR